MEGYRRAYRNNTEDELKVLQKSIKHAEDTIYRLTHDKQPFRTIQLVTKARENLDKLLISKKEMENKLALIESGGYDEIILSEMKENRKIEAEKAQKTSAKKKKSSPRAKSPVVFHKREYQVSEKDMAIEFERFKKSVFRLPESLDHKLKSMPNNHGVIFNDIWFFGLAPEKRPYNTIVLQEKRYQDFYVHYYTPHAHSVFIKQGSGRNTREVLESKVVRYRIK
jgi:hypothetical protein